MTQPKLIGYKVVHVRRYHYSSAIPALATNLQYFISKWTTPKKGDGPMAVFTTYAGASSFIAYLPSHHRSSQKAIFKCEYVQSKKQRHLKSGPYRRYDVPEHTDFATRVRLIERAKHD